MKILLPLLVSIAAMVALCALAGCGGGGGGGGGGDGVSGSTDRSGPSDDEMFSALHSVGLIDASMVVMTGADPVTKPSDASSKSMSVRASSGESTRLEPNTPYMVTPGGVLVPIKTFDPEGAPFEGFAIRARQVTDLNDVYAIVWLQASTGSDGSTLSNPSNSRPYLVDKRNGRAYDAGNASFGGGFVSSWYPHWGATNVPYARTDDNGDIYLMMKTQGNWRASMYHIDISELGDDGMVAKPFVHVDDVDPKRFRVSGDGSFGYYEGKEFDTGDRVWRLVNIETGALANIAPLLPAGFSATSIEHAFRGSDGGLYMVDRNASYERRLLRLGMGAVAGSVVDVGPLTNLGSSSWVGIRDTHERCVIDGRVFLVDRIPVEIDTTARTYAILDQGEDRFIKVNEFMRRGGAVWYFGAGSTESSFSGTDGVVRFDLATGGITEFTLPINWDMQFFRVLDEDEIWFQALDLTDSSKLFGSLTADGTVTELEVLDPTGPNVLDMHMIRRTDFFVTDGASTEWAEGDRVLIDAIDDPVEANAIAYSQVVDPVFYYGLVEFDGPRYDGITSVIDINGDYEIRISGSVGVVRDVAGGTTTSINSAGGAFADGQAVEFKLPMIAIGEPAGPIVPEARIVAPAYESGIASVGESIAGGFVDLVVAMQNPLVASSASFVINGAHTVEFDATSASVNSVNFSVISGASITYPVVDGDDVMITLPLAAIGDPVSVSVDELSSPVPTGGERLIDEIIPDGITRNRLRGQQIGRTLGVLAASIR